jgi:hypothetical protein
MLLSFPQAVLPRPAFELGAARMLNKHLRY